MSKKNTFFASMPRGPTSDTGARFSTGPEAGSDQVPLGIDGQVPAGSLQASLNHSLEPLRHDTFTDWFVGRVLFCPLSSLGGGIHKSSCFIASDPCEPSTVTGYQPQAGTLLLLASNAHLPNLPM